MGRGLSSTGLVTANDGPERWASLSPLGPVRQGSRFARGFWERSLDPAGYQQSFYRHTRRMSKGEADSMDSRLHGKLSETTELQGQPWILLWSPCYVK